MSLGTVLILIGAAYLIYRLGRRHGRHQGFSNGYAEGYAAGVIQIIEDLSSVDDDPSPHVEAQRRIAREGGQ